MLRYCGRVASHLGDLMRYVTTFNEPNLPMQLRWLPVSEIPIVKVKRMARQAAKAVGSDQFGCFFLGDAKKLQERMIAAHHRAIVELKSGPGRYPVGDQCVDSG